MMGFWMQVTSTKLIFHNEVILKFFRELLISRPYLENRTRWDLDQNERNDRFPTPTQ